MTDEKMNGLLKESFVRIYPDRELQEKLLQKLYAQEQRLSGRQRGTRHNLRRRVLTTACVLAALLVTGCAAVGVVKHYHATEVATAYESYAELQQAEKNLGKAFASVEHFSNGFDFQSAALVNTEALGEKEEKLFGDHLLELFYQKGTDIITVGVETAEVGERVAHKSFEELMKDAMADEQNSVTELETVDGIRVYYEGYARKYVPDGYQLTPYDQTSIAAGKYEIVYGAEGQYMKCMSRVMLEMDGLIYCINYRCGYSNWDKYGAEELGQMAAEIIRAGK